MTIVRKSKRAKTRTLVLFRIAGFTRRADVKKEEAE
jgi:hypothetical protein